MVAKNKALLTNIRQYEQIPIGFNYISLGPIVDAFSLVFSFGVRETSSNKLFSCLSRADCSKPSSNAQNQVPMEPFHGREARKKVLIE